MAYNSRLQQSCLGPRSTCNPLDGTPRRTYFMTATSSLTGAPRNALRFWAEGRNIFVEIPAAPTCPDQPACIIKFPYGPVGLAKALDLLGVLRYDYSGEILT